MIFGSYGFLGQEPGAPCPGQPKQRPNNVGGSPGARRTGIPRQRRPKNEAHVDELAGGANPWVKVVSVFSLRKQALKFVFCVCIVVDENTGETCSKNLLHFHAQNYAKHFLVHVFNIRAHTFKISRGLLLV